MIKRFFTSSCIAGCAIALMASTAVAGPVSYHAGDLLLGVRAAGGTGATQDYLVNLGPASQFVGIHSGGSFTPSVGDIGADLTQIFGANWSSRADLFWSVSGTTGLLSPANGDPAKTLYATKAENPAGTLATPWNRAAENTQGPAASKITAMGQAYAQTAGQPNQSTANSPAAVVQNTSDVNNYASYQPGGSTQNAGPQPGISFAYFNPSIEASFATGASGSALDLFRLIPGSGPGETLGTFTFDSNGTLTFSGPTPSNHLANIATRVKVGTADKILIGGFIVQGVGPKKVYVDARGPSLAVERPKLTDPVLSIIDSDGQTVATNDNWVDSPDRQAITDTGAAPPDSAEAAVIVTLQPGAYTAQVSGVNGGTGVGLVEIYDLAQGASAQLANIATRGDVQTGDDVLIGGTIITGDMSAKIVARAIGTSLSIPGRLEDPTLEIVNADGTTIASNDNWRESQQAAAIEATGLQPSQDAESAILIDLPPASYTAIVRGAGNSTGIGSVELYKLPN